MRPKTLTLYGWGPCKMEETVDFTAFEDKGIFLIAGEIGAGKTPFDLAEQTEKLDILGKESDNMLKEQRLWGIGFESLDQACDTLMSLAEKKQLIGIISHVPELRERIGNQLIIEKTGSGSRIISR